MRLLWLVCITVFLVVGHAFGQSAFAQEYVPGMEKIAELKESIAAARVAAPTKVWPTTLPENMDCGPDHDRQYATACANQYAVALSEMDDIVTQLEIDLRLRKKGIVVAPNKNGANYERSAKGYKFFGNTAKKSAVDEAEKKHAAAEEVWLQENKANPYTRSLSPEVNSVGTGTALHVYQIINERTAILGWRSDRPIWVDGLSMRGIIDNEIIQICAPIRIVGTKQYQTVSGSTATILKAESYLPTRPTTRPAE